MKRFLYFTIIMLLAACNHDKRHPDISNIKADISVERFDKDFFRIDSNHITDGLVYLRNAYPDFYGIYMSQILGINPADSGGQFVIHRMLHDYRPLYDSLNQKYPDFGFLQNDLSKSFRYVKYYYPEYPVPGKLITYITTFDGAPAWVSPQFIAVGLQQFAGKNFSAYEVEEIREMYAEYISRRFDKEYIASRLMFHVVQDLYPNQSVGRPLLEQMVENGKQWFLLDHLMPDAADSVKTGFTAKQLKWSADNEGAIWTQLLHENLYSIEPATIQTYLGEQPFTQGFPEGSPGNIGQWVGWRIVQKYADKHNDLSLQQVLATPAKKLFDDSGYKPK